MQEPKTFSVKSTHPFLETSAGMIHLSPRNFSFLPIDWATKFSESLEPQISKYHSQCQEKNLKDESREVSLPVLGFLCLTIKNPSSLLSQKRKDICQHDPAPFPNSHPRIRTLIESLLLSDPAALLLWRAPSKHPPAECSPSEARSPWRQRLERATGGQQYLCVSRFHVHSHHHPSSPCPSTLEKVWEEGGGLGTSLGLSQSGSDSIHLS